MNNRLLTILYDAAKHLDAITITVHSPAGDVSARVFVAYLKTMGYGQGAHRKIGVDNFKVKVVDQGD